MSPDDDLDDLLSSLDATDPSEWEERPHTELIDPSAVFGDENSDSMPVIRTPLPPGMRADPEPESAPAPAPAPALNAAPLTLDPDEPLGLPDTRASLSTDADAAFAAAEARQSQRSLDAQQAADAAASADEDSRRIKSDDEVLLSTPQRRGMPTIVWAGIVSFCVAALGAILYTQIDSLHPERQATRDRLSASSKDRAVAAHRRAQPVPGSVTITSQVEGAAVWMLLGRTPLESIALSSGQVHEVRFELPGYKTTFATIDRSHWKGEGENAKAVFSAALTKGAETTVAFPPQPAVRPPRGPVGRGTLVFDSTPAGARAWLLIGFTPQATLRGIESGRRYEFRVNKDGYLPGYTEVEETDWSSGRTQATRVLELLPARASRR